MVNKLSTELPYWFNPLENTPPSTPSEEAKVTTSTVTTDPRQRVAQGKGAEQWVRKLLVPKSSPLLRSQHHELMLATTLPSLPEGSVPLGLSTRLHGNASSGKETEDSVSASSSSVRRRRGSSAGWSLTSLRNLLPKNNSKTDMSSGFNRIEMSNFRPANSLVSPEVDRVEVPTFVPAESLAAGTMEEFLDLLRTNHISADVLRNIKQAVDGKAEYATHPDLARTITPEGAEAGRTHSSHVMATISDAIVKAFDKTYGNDGIHARARQPIEKLLGNFYQPQTPNAEQKAELATYENIVTMVDFWADFGSALAAKGMQEKEIQEIRSYLIEHDRRLQGRVNFLAENVVKGYLNFASFQESSKGVDGKIAPEYKTFDTYLTYHLDTKKSKTSEAEYIPTIAVINHARKYAEKERKERGMRLKDSDTSSDEVRKKYQGQVNEIFDKYKEDSRKVAWTQVENYLSRKNVPQEQIDKLKAIKRFNGSPADKVTEWMNIATETGGTGTGFRQAYLVQEALKVGNSRLGGNSILSAEDIANLKAGKSGEVGTQKLNKADIAEIKVWISDFLQQAIDGLSDGVASSSGTSGI